MATPLKLFFSYSHEDEKKHQEIETELDNLEEQLA